MPANPPTGSTPKFPPVSVFHCTWSSAFLPAGMLLVLSQPLINTVDPWAIPTDWLTSR